jgi:hypothetical protein
VRKSVDDVKAKMTLLKFLNQKSFGLTLHCFVRGWGHDEWVDPHSPFICDMCDEQATIHHPSQNFRFATKVLSKWEIG